MMILQNFTMCKPATQGAVLWPLKIFARAKKELRSTAGN